MTAKGLGSNLESAMAAGCEEADGLANAAKEKLERRRIQAEKEKDATFAEQKGVALWKTHGGSSKAGTACKGEAPPPPTTLFSRCSRPWPFPSR